MGDPVFVRNAAQEADAARRERFAALGVWQPPGPLLVDECPPAPDWFFVASLGRTGSSIMARMLSLHPDICCTIDDNVMPTLSSALRSPALMLDCEGQRINYEAHQPVLTSTLRSMMQVWRESVSGCAFFGDKSPVYLFQRELTEAVFPGCRWLRTVRHPLDMQSSRRHQSWFGADTEEECIAQLAREVDVAAQVESEWQGWALTLRFEDFATPDQAEEQMRWAFEYLGVDPGLADWSAILDSCHHRQAIGRWESDPLIPKVMDALTPRALEYVMRYESGLDNGPMA